MNNNLSYLLKLKRQRKLSVDNTITIIIFLVLGIFFALPMPITGWIYATKIIQPNTVFDELTKVILVLLSIDVGIKCIFSKSSIAELCALKLLPIPKYELYLQNIKNKLFSGFNYCTHLFTLPLIVGLYVHSQLTLSYSITFIVFYTLLMTTNTFIIICIKSFNGWKREFTLVLLWVLFQSLSMLFMKNDNVILVISENLIQNQILLVVFSIVLLVLIATLSVYQCKNEFIKFLENKSNSSADIVSYNVGSRFNFSPLTIVVIKTTIKNINAIFGYILFILFSFYIFNNQGQTGNTLILIPMLMILLPSSYIFWNQTLANISFYYEGLSGLYKNLIYQINKTDININYFFAAISSLCLLIASKDINIALISFFIGAGLNAYMLLYINKL